MRVVIDTNVLVSGLLSPYGPSSEVIQLLLAEKISIAYDARILSEYKEVLLRPKFQFHPDRVTLLLDYLQATGKLTVPSPLSFQLSDKDDEPFLETAIAAQVDYLITGNLKHFPKKTSISIGTPSDFLLFFRKHD